MRSLSEIVQANKEFEERDKAGDFDHEEVDHHGQGVSVPVNRCKACDEPVEDCLCDRELGGGTVQE